MKKIKELEERVSCLEDRLWSLENPYKFNINDKVDISFVGENMSGVVVDRYVFSCDSFLDGHANYYKIFCDQLYTVEESKITIDEEN